MITYGRLVEPVAFCMKELSDGLHRIFDEAVLVEKLDTLHRLLAEQSHATFLRIFEREFYYDQFDNQHF